MAVELTEYNGFTSSEPSSLLLVEDLSLHDNEDELHQAARLGKALLEQKQALEMKVQRLSIALDESQAENTRLSHQVSSLKESYRNLEEDRDVLETSLVKIEEEAKGLRKKTFLTTVQVGDLETNVEMLREQCQNRQDELDKVRAENQQLHVLKEDNDLHSTGEVLLSLTQSDIERSNQGSSQELLEVRTELGELKYQRSVETGEWEEEVARLKAENRSLQMELRLAKTLADDLEEQQSSTPRLNRSIGPRLAFSPSESPVLSPEVGVMGKGVTPGDFQSSLWTEIEAQYETLQRKFEVITQRCCCGAVTDSVSAPTTSHPAQSSLPSIGRTTHHELFKDLFEMLHRFKTELHT